MAKNVHGGSENQVLNAFHAVDLGAPFKVILNNCVTAEVNKTSGEIISYTIPDFEGLVRSVVMARLVHDRKLNGAELRFLRKAVGIPQVDLARILDCKPEHLSKVEAGRYPLTTMAERWARMFLFEKAAKLHKMEDDKLREKLHELLEKMFAGMKPIAAFEIGELEFFFHREPTHAAASDAANDDWAETDHIVSSLDEWSDGGQQHAACG